MPALRLSWLGHPAIERDGVPVRLEMRENTALLASVSLSDRPVSRERLAAIFWPDFDRERAPANLRRSLASQQRTRRTSIQVSSSSRMAMLSRSAAKAAEAIERSHREILTRGGLAQLLRWCRDIPREVYETMPGFCEAAGWGLGWGGRGQEAEAFLEIAEKRLALEGAAGGAASGESPENRALRGVIAISRAFIADLAGDTVRSIQLAGTASELLPVTDFLCRAVIPYIIGKASRYRGDLKKAEEACGEFLQTGRAAGNIWSISGAVYEMVQVYRLQGRLHDALRLIGDLEQQAEQHRARGTGPIAKTYAIKSELIREMGRLDEAREIVEEAVRKVDTWGLPSDVYVSHQYLARVLRSQGETERALEELEKVHDLPRRALVYASLYPAFESDRVKTWLAAGDLPSAQAWVRGYRPGKSETVVNREIEQVAHARVLLASEADPSAVGQASALLEELARGARSGGRAGQLIEILVLQARAASARGSGEDAVRALTEALRLAQPAGYFQTFVEEGPRIADLLKKGLAAGSWDDAPLRAFVESLLPAP